MYKINPPVVNYYYYCWKNTDYRVEIIHARSCDRSVNSGEVFNLFSKIRKKEIFNEQENTAILIVCSRGVENCQFQNAAPPACSFSFSFLFYILFRCKKY